MSNKVDRGMGISEIIKRKPAAR